MKRSALFLLILLLVPAAVRADFDAAMEAYRNRDYATAFALFEAVAREGSAEALFNVGVMYYRGQGVERDLVQAFTWVELAATRNPREFHEAHQVLIMALDPEQRRLAASAALALAEELGMRYQPPSHLAQMGTAEAQFQVRGR